jgi:hypothetical protein
MNTDALIAMLHTNQLPYKRLYAGDFIYELAPKNIGFNHKVAVPDALRLLLGEHVSIGIFTLSDTDSLWHGLLYAIMPEKYESYNWHYRKLMVEQLITAMDECISRTFVKNRVLTGSTLKPDSINFRATRPSPELLFYICLVLNINIVIYYTGMFNRVEYHFPTARYDPSLPLIILHADDKPIISVIAVNDQSVYDGNNFTSKQIATGAPKEHKVLSTYAGPKCPSDIYAQIFGLSEEAGFRREKSIELMKMKVANLKEYAILMGIHTDGSGRCTKQMLVDKIIDKFLKNQLKK